MPDIILAAPMVDFQCNQKGCCCKDWSIPFRPEDLSRMASALGEREAQDRLSWGLEFVLDDDEKTIESVQLSRLPPDDRCRFLEREGGCELHRRFGTKALPELCINFPVVAFDTGDSIELHYEAVCPSVIDQLAHSDVPYLEKVLDPTGQADIAMRASRPQKLPSLDLDNLELTWPQLLLVRRRLLASLTDLERPAIEHLCAISHALDRLRSNADVEGFEVVYDDPTEDFYDFFEKCATIHGGEALAHMWGKYKRFVWDFDRDDPRLDRIDLCFENWREHLEAHMIGQEPALRPLLVRYLSHRYYSIFIKIRGELIFAYGSVPHAQALGLRTAAALSGALERPTDLGIMKAAIGFADYVYRNLRIPHSSLPWFTPGSTPPNLGR